MFRFFKRKSMEESLGKLDYHYEIVKVSLVHYLDETSAIYLALRVPNKTTSDEIQSWIWSNYRIFRHGILLEQVVSFDYYDQFFNFKKEAPYKITDWSGLIIDFESTKHSICPTQEMIVNSFDHWWYENINGVQ